MFSTPFGTLSRPVYRQVDEHLVSQPLYALEEFILTWSVRRLYFFFRGSIHIVDHELFKKYNSPVIRAGPNRLIFSSAAAWRVTHGYSERFERGDMFILSRFADTTESSVFTAKTHQEHRAKRKALISAAMTPRAFAGYEPHLARNCYKWLSIVERELAERGPDFDPSKSLKALGFDAFFEMLTGSPIGCLNDGLWETEAFAEAIKQKERTSRDSFGFGLVPWYVDGKIGPMLCTGYRHCSSRY